MNVSYRKQLYNTYRKKSFQDIPRLCAIFFSVAVLSVLFYLIVIAVYGENVSKITVAYVTDNEDFSLKSELKYITRNSNCEFKRYKKSKALKALDDKEVAAVLEISEDRSISFSYYDNDEFLTYLFGDMIEAGMSDYLVINTTTKTINHIQDNYSKKELQEIKNELTDYLIYRNSNYNRIVYSDTGDVPLKYFYAGTGVALLALLSASVIIGFMKKDDELFLTFAKRVGIKNKDIFLARYIPIVIIYEVLTLIGIFIFQLTYIGAIIPVGLLSALLATLLLLLTIILIHEIIENKIIATLVALLASLLTMFISGCIVPLSYLPKGINWCSKFMPTKYATQIYSQLFFGRTNIRTTVFSAVYILVLVVITLAYISLKERFSTNETD